MSSAKRRLQRALQKSFATKLNKPDELPARMGTYRGGAQVVAVDGRDGWVYVRVRGDQSEELVVFNDQVNNVFDLPVIIVRESQDLGFYRVKGRNIGVYQAWTGHQTGGISPHAHTHERKPDDPGNDIVSLYKSQFMPMALSPWPTGTSMAAVVRADYYLHEDTMKFWPGGGTSDFTSAKPSTSQKRFITVAMDGVENRLEYFTGQLFNSENVVDFAPYMPVPNIARYIPLGAVLLASGTSYLSYSILHDIRPFMRTSPTGVFGGGGSSSSASLWQPVTNGALTGTDLVFADGDVIMADGDY
jgi:hypothetical protein